MDAHSFCFWEFKTIFITSILIFFIELQLSLNRVHIFKFITRSHITLNREDIPCSILEDVSRFGNESGLVRRQYHENVLEILRVHQEKMIHITFGIVGCKINSFLFRCIFVRLKFRTHIGFRRIIQYCLTYSIRYVFIVCNYLIT